MTGAKTLSDIVAQCMHCGLCLPSCPTYGLTKNETSSPRGRIRLVKGIAAGEIPVSPHFNDEMQFCLGCYACMSACPAGVRYDEILETGRSYASPGFLRKSFLRFFFLKKSRLHFFAKILRPFLIMGRCIFGGIARLAPLPEKKYTRQLLPSVISAQGPLRARVALFTGCIMDVASASIHADSAEVLARNGCEVHLLPDEECCGALLGHAGDHEAAQVLAMRNIAAFEKAGLDGLIVNAAGCGAYLKKYAALVGKASQHFCGKVWDIQEFLEKLGLAEMPGSLAKKITTQEPCHLVHGQKISGQVTNLLKKIPDLTIVPLEGAKDCCGSAGIYNITHYRDAMRLLDGKMECIAKTGADIVVVANPGCLFQLQYGIRRRGLAMEALHPMSLLARAYRQAP